YPVLADGMLPHTDPFTGPQSFQVTLPADVTCAGCTLQVLEFMQADVGASGNCFYHHCANISIGAGAADAGGGGGGSRGGGCGGASPAAVLLAGLLGLTLARRRRRALLVAAPFLALAAAAAGCGDDRPAFVGFGVSPGDVERAWLERVGTGPAQTAAACGRGA